MRKLHENSREWNLEIFRGCSDFSYVTSPTLLIFTYLQGCGSYYRRRARPLFTVRSVVSNLLCVCLGGVTNGVYSRRVLCIVWNSGVVLFFSVRNFVVIADARNVKVVAFSRSTAAILTLAARYFFIISDFLVFWSFWCSAMSRLWSSLSGLRRLSHSGMILSNARVLCVSALPLRLRPRAENRLVDVGLCLGGVMLESRATFVELVSGVS